MPAPISSTEPRKSSAAPPAPSVVPEETSNLKYKLADLEMYKFYDKDLADQAAKELGMVENEATKTLFKMRKHSIFLDNTLLSLCQGYEASRQYGEAKKGMRDIMSKRIERIDEVIHALNNQIDIVRTASTERTLQRADMCYSPDAEKIVTRAEREAEMAELEEVLEVTRSAVKKEEEPITPGGERDMDMDTSSSSPTSSYHRSFEQNQVY